MKSKHKRTIVKSMTWRIIATMTTISLVYFVTGNIAASFQIGAAEIIIKSAVYYVHERAWSNVRWGYHS